MDNNLEPRHPNTHNNPNKGYTPEYGLLDTPDPPEYVDVGFNNLIIFKN